MSEARLEKTAQAMPEGNRPHSVQYTNNMTNRRNDPLCDSKAADAVIPTNSSGHPVSPNIVDEYVERTWPSFLGGPNLRLTRPSPPTDIIRIFCGGYGRFLGRMVSGRIDGSGIV